MCFVIILYLFFFIHNKILRKPKLLLIITAGFIDQSPTTARISRRALSHRGVDGEIFVSLPQMNFLYFRRQ